MRRGARSRPAGSELLQLVGLAVALLLSAPALCQESPEDEQPAFSRLRWIAERMDRVRFDGGLLPSAQDSFGPWETSTRVPAEVGRGPRNRRVSLDILPEDPASEAEHESQAEPSFSIDPRNEQRLVGAYQESRFADGGARALTAALSVDGGRRWREQLVPGLTVAAGGPFDRASDPWVAFGPEGRVYFASIAFNANDPRNGVFLSVSKDGGATWLAPSTVHEGDADEFDDKEAVTADTYPQSPYYGRVYVAWDTVTSDNRQILRAAFSSDGGATFSPPVDLTDFGANIGAIPLVAPDGSVHLLWKRYLGDETPLLLASRSFDGGASWSEPGVVAELRTVGVEGVRTGAMFDASVDPVRGHLYAAWADSRFTGIDQIAVSWSYNGVDWSTPLRVSDGPGNAPSFTPAIAVNRKGQFGVSYATLRHDPGRSFLVDQYLVTSNARRRPRRASRLSTRTFDVRNAPLARGFFLGDYTGLVAGRVQFRALWVSTPNRARSRPGRQSDAVTVLVR